MGVLAEALSRRATDLLAQPGRYLSYRATGSVVRVFENLRQAPS